MVKKRTVIDRPAGARGGDFGGNFGETAREDCQPLPTPTQSSFRAVSVVTDRSSSLTSEGSSALEDVIAIDDSEEGSETGELDKPDIVAHEGAPRRSGRKRKSTIVYIDGNAVLAKNNYVLKGDSYSFGAFKTETKKQKRTQGKKIKSPVKPRTVSTAEKNRTAHNDAVKKRVAEKERNRTIFLSKHVDLLSPFIGIRVETRLRSFAKHFKYETGKNADDMFIQPDLIQAEMRDYQLIGLNWMAKMHRSNLGMILGDEMGLGKTLQTISLICHLKETEEMVGPSLVICPLSVLYSWCNEITKWAPSLKFLRLHSSCLEEREAQKHSFIKHASEYDIVVTTYEMAKNPALKSLWQRTHFNYLVLDEGHKIKEHTSQISRAVRSIHRENSLILTGTPLQNNLVELWSLLNFLYPDVFVESDPFGDAFDITHKIIDQPKLELAHKLLELFMLRRLKTEVEKLMPPKIETKVMCPLSKTQTFWYKGLLLKDINLLARAMERESGGEVGPTNGGKLNNLIMQLRKCCLHPFLFDGAEVDIESTTMEELIAASGKLAVLDKLLRSLHKKGHRVVLFSQFTSVLDIIEDYCNMREWTYCRFDGCTPRARRNFLVNQFNAPGSDTYLFLMSTKAGGIGLNLQTADTCILYDSDWNPQPDIQAMARVHRIGQKKTVHIYRLVCGGTIEERIAERAEKKLYLDQMVNRGSVGGPVSVPEKDEGSKFLAALKFGCDAVFGDSSQNVLPSTEDIEVITNRARTEDYSSGKLKGGVTQTAKDFDTERELSCTTKFQGVDFKALRDKIHREKEENIPKSLRGLADGWAQVHEQEKRKRKNRLVMVKGTGSGYGSAFVPVLSENNYALEKGESSVFERELGGKGGKFGEVKSNRQYSGKDFGQQDFCQACGEAEELIHCNLCPVSYHQGCAEAEGVIANGISFSCSHHHCKTCGKNHSASGGLLFPCQSCPNSYCEDCLPKKGVSLLGKCERFEELGFNSKRNFAYIHCSGICEKVAIEEFDWAASVRKRRQCPEPVDVSYNFDEVSIKP